MNFTHFAVTYLSLASPVKPFQTPAGGGIDHSQLWTRTLSAILSHSLLNFYLRVCLPLLDWEFLERKHNWFLYVYSPLASKQGLSSGFVKWKTQCASTRNHFTIMFLSRFTSETVSFHITARLLEWDENELETAPDLSDLAPNYKHLAFFVNCTMRQENKNGVYLIRSSFLGRHMR